MNHELYFHKEVTNNQGNTKIISLKEPSLRALPDNGSFASLPQTRPDKLK